VSDVKFEPKHSAADRVPQEVPHHPKILTVGAAIALASLGLMVLWFWSVNTGQGVILTAEQQRAAETQANRDAEADAAAAADKTDADLDREAETNADKKNNKKDKGKKGAPPPAPAASDTATDEVILSNYAILSQQGVLAISGDLQNVSGEELYGTVKAYVYVDGEAIATASADVNALAPGATENITLQSSSDYVPGEKVVLLKYKANK
jgi:hypothetical protein